MPVFLDRTVDEAMQIVCISQRGKHSVEGLSGVTRLTFRAGASAAIWSPVLPPCHTCSADSKLTRWTVDLTDAFPFSPFLKVLSPYRFSFKIYVICFRHLFIFHVLAKIIFLWRLKTHDILTI